MQKMRRHDFLTITAGTRTPKHFVASRSVMAVCGTRAFPTACFVKGRIIKFVTQSAVVTLSSMQTACPGPIFLRNSRRMLPCSLR